MKHIDLFSGIGGFSYAADQVWKLEHIFCDIDPFCRAITNKHWPNAKHYGNINHLITDATGIRRNGEPSSGEGIQGNGTRRETRTGFEQTFLVTGGFPCQPFSQAGRRRGTADDRYLWPPMFRVIQLTAPAWVIAENVAGLVTWNDGMVLEQVCTDLESEGYEVQPVIIPACAVNAPHRRDRVWIVANRTHVNGKRSKSGRDSLGEPQAKAGNGSGDAYNSLYTGLERHADTNQRPKERKAQARSNAPTGWEKDWIEVASRLCGVDDGLPARVDGVEISKSRHRKERLKSLGNAIVPQVAVEIMKAIQTSLVSPA